MNSQNEFILTEWGRKIAEGIMVKFSPNCTRKHINLQIQESQHPPRSIQMKKMKQNETCKYITVKILKAKKEKLKAAKIKTTHYKQRHNDD